MSRRGSRIYSDNEPPSFKTRFEELLFQRDLSNREFALKFNVAESTVSGYLLGKRTPNLELFIEMCDFFAVSADWLLGRSDIKEILDGKEDSE